MRPSAAEQRSEPPRRAGEHGELAPPLGGQRSAEWGEITGEVALVVDRALARRGIDQPVGERVGVRQAVKDREPHARTSAVLAGVRSCARSNASTSSSR
jgi:hypothetical protein